MQAQRAQRGPRAAQRRRQPLELVHGQPQLNEAGGEVAPRAQRAQRVAGQVQLRQRHVHQERRDLTRAVGGGSKGDDCALTRAANITPQEIPMPWGLLFVLQVISTFCSRSALSAGRTLAMLWRRLSVRSAVSAPSAGGSAMHSSWLQEMVSVCSTARRVEMHRRGW